MNKNEKKAVKLLNNIVRKIIGGRILILSVDEMFGTIDTTDYTGIIRQEYTGQNTLIIQWQDRNV